MQRRVQTGAHGASGVCILTDFAATRAEALARWREFLPEAPRYALRRNFVQLGHPAVSRLSGAIRHRLVLESELVAALLDAHPPAAVEKLLQEIHWRGYWKAWLERRPSVWREWVESVPLRRAELGAVARQRLEKLEAGDSGVAVMDAFARELIATGYLHNHARMWFASFWVHVEGLPWELGAAFFFRHLIDGDAASNTLSWRWVAGLHTAGKRYFVRRSNLEKYLDTRLLANASGLERLDDAAIAAIESRTPAPRVLHPPPLAVPPSPVRWPGGALAARRAGLWLHDEDGCPELSPLAELRPAALLVTGDALTAWQWRHGAARRAFAARALTDAAARAGAHFGADLPVECTGLADDIAVADALERGAVRYGLDVVAGLAPAVGPLADQLPRIEARLAAHGVRLVLLHRSADLERLPHAAGGFYQYWTRVAPALGAARRDQ